MCDIAGIESEYVSGYIRTEYYQIGSPGELDQNNMEHGKAEW